MSYSSLKRKTPLRAKIGFKPSCGLKKKEGGQTAKRHDKKPSDAKEKPRMARKSERSSLTTHLDLVFSLYIRLRDAMFGGMTKCISCGRMLPFSQIQCGHYFTRHNMSVRWDEDNCHAQCVECNCHKSGNVECYTPSLIAKIGQAAFDSLCVRARGERHWHGEELREMVRHYTEEARRLSREKGVDVKV